MENLKSGWDTTREFLLNYVLFCEWFLFCFYSLICVVRDVVHIWNNVKLAARKIFSVLLIGTRPSFKESNFAPKNYFFTKIVKI